MIRLVVAALALTSATVVIHGIGTVAVTGRVARLWSRRRGGRLDAELVMAQLVSSLLLLHLA
jgi:hypothetical protein